MPRFDMGLAGLQDYKPDVLEPDDFDDFWATTISEARSFDNGPRVRSVTSHLESLEVLDFEFPGFAGDPVKGWLTMPSRLDGSLPAVVEFNGYGGGRGLPAEHITWAAAGYIHLFVDSRGQGSGTGSGGSTPDPHGSEPSFPGFMTRGIQDPENYYYRRVFTDAVRAVDAVRSLQQVDPARVIVTGASQGGGMVLAVAALCEGLLAALPDVPFLCHFDRAIGLTGQFPYQEIVQYLAVHRGAEERIFKTLSYFDGVNMAARATAPALFSVALLDQVCPPSTVYAAFNRYAARDKEIEVNRPGFDGGSVYLFPAPVGTLLRL